MTSEMHRGKISPDRHMQTKIILKVKKTLKVVQNGALHITKEEKMQREKKESKNKQGQGRECNRVKKKIIT